MIRSAMIRTVALLLVLAATIAFVACDAAEEAVSNIQTQRAQTAEAPGPTDEGSAGEPTDAPEATEPPQATDEPDATDAPDATEAPEPTDAPEPTEAPEPTDAPEPTQPPDTGGQATEEPPADELEKDDDGVPVWVWVIVAAVGAFAGIAIIGAVVGRMRRSSAAVRGAWQRQASDIYSTGAALHDSINVELSAGARADVAAGRWQEAEGRMDALATELHALETQDLNEKNGLAVQNLLASLNALRAASQADATLRSQADPSPPDAVTASEGALRQRLGEFNEALQALRATL
jgi:hypothetical protein